jgi:hypothetical protein
MLASPAYLCRMRGREVGDKHEIRFIWRKVVNCGSEGVGVDVVALVVGVLAAVVSSAGG